MLSITETCLGSSATTNGAAPWSARCPTAEPPSRPAVGNQDVSDELLLARVARQDAEALSVLYDRFAGLLNGLALRILQDPQEAEDVLQESFVQIWNKASQYDPALGKPLSWAVALTRNRSIDRLRSRQRRDRVFQAPADTADEKACTNPTATELSSRAGDSAVVRAALHALPQDQRVAIELAFFSGLTQTEIADKLGEPLGTVKARIRRGMLKLRDTLENPNRPASAP